MSTWADPPQGLIAAGIINPAAIARQLGLVINVIRDYGASGSNQSTTGTINAGSSTLTLAAAIDFVNGQGISVANAGPLPSISAPTAATATATGTAGTTTIQYAVAALDGKGGVTAVFLFSLTNANATLSATNYNALAVTAVAGAAGYAWWRTSTNGTSPTTTGFIGITTGTTLSDTGLAVLTPPTGIPASAPSTALGDLLVTFISNGAGTLTLTLATSATNAASALTVQHDDTAAIQAAANAASGGKTLFIPDGTYMVSSTITISSNTTIVGGISSIIQTAQGFSGNPFYANNASNITVDTLVIKGNGSSDLQSGTEWNNVTDLWLLNLLVKNTAQYNPIQLQSCTRAHVRDCTVESPSLSDCIAISGCTDSQIENCNAYSPWDTGFVVAAGCDNCSITGGTVRRSQTGVSNAQSIAIAGSTHITVSGTVIEGGGTSQQGVRIEQDPNTLAYCFDVVVSGLTVNNCGSNGIIAVGLNRGIISNNNVTGCGRNIWLESCNSITLHGNVTMNATSGYDGLLLSGCTNCVVSGGVSGDDQVTHTQGYGVRCLDNGTTLSQNNLIIGVRVFNNTTLQLALGGSSKTDQAINNPGYNPVGAITPPASPLVSGTVYQNTYGSPITIYQPAYTTVAGTVAVALGPTSTPPTIYTKQVAATTTAAQPDVDIVRVPPGFYFSFTATSATLATATIQGE